MSEIYNLIAWAIIIALTSAFFILFIGKIGTRDFIIEQGPKLLSEMFSCDFCLSFWVSLILAIILALLTLSPELLVVPFISTPITRFLL